MEGQIKLGAPLDVADTILPPVLTHIARHAPRVRMEIRVDRSPFLMDALQSGGIDLNISPPHSPDLTGIALPPYPTPLIRAADYTGQAACREQVCHTS